MAHIHIVSQIGFIEPTVTHRNAVAQNALAVLSPSKTQAQGRITPAKDSTPTGTGDGVERTGGASVLRTIRMSKSASGACTDMYQTKRHVLAERLVQQELAAGAAQEPSTSESNLQDLLDIAAKSASDMDVQRAYVALMRRLATFYPCMEPECELAEQRLVNDLLHIQGICHSRCDPDRDSADIYTCTSTMRRCLAGINRMLVALQPVECSRSIVVGSFGKPDDTTTRVLRAAANIVRQEAAN